jgi:hypothetical protein
MEERVNFHEKGHAAMKGLYEHRALSGKIENWALAGGFDKFQGIADQNKRLHVIIQVTRLTYRFKRKNHL